MEIVSADLERRLAVVSDSIMSRHPEALYVPTLLTGAVQIQQDLDSFLILSSWGLLIYSSISI